MREYIKYQNIVEYLDIEKGDVLTIGSDLTDLSFVAMRNGERFNPDKFIDSIINKLGSEGTLLLPTFNWGFCEGKTFDINKTKSKTGSLSKAALKRSDFKRTRHPIYSFAVWGADQSYLCNLNNKSSFGSDSPFTYLHENDGKMIIIGREFFAFAFGHYVERSEEVDYRYEKEFTAPYIDSNGNLSERTYSMYVRDLDKGVINTMPKIGKVLLEEGVAEKKEINCTKFYTVDLAGAYEVVKNEIRNNNARLLHKKDN